MTEDWAREGLNDLRGSMAGTAADGTMGTAPGTSATVSSASAAASRSAPVGSELKRASTAGSRMVVTTWSRKRSSSMAAPPFPPSPSRCFRAFTASDTAPTRALEPAAARRDAPSVSPPRAVMARSASSMGTNATSFFS